MSASSALPPGELAGGVTLDSLFRANAANRPDATALIDPRDRASFTDGQPKRLNYAEANAAIDRLAQRLRSFGSPAGGVVVVQLPNIVESVISLLAVLRAGLIAAPVPMLWRRSDLVAALARLEPKALITLARVDGERPAETACEAAAELFHLSFPCAFGSDVPDGVIALDRDDAGVEAQGVRLSAVALENATAIATFDAGPEGFFATARNDAQWLAAGIATLLEAGIESGDTIVSTLPPNSLAAIGAAFVPWLLSGGTLKLVHGNASGAIAAVPGRAHLVVPAAALPAIARKLPAALVSCIAVHRNPATIGRDFSEVASERIVDLFAFGESGAVTLLRENRRRAWPIPVGPISAPSATGGAPVVIETRLGHGEMMLRGPMVPRTPFPASAASPRLALGEDGFVRTGYRCHGDGNGGLIVDAAPDRVVTIGGLRFGLDDLQSRLANAFAGIKVRTINDPLLGERLRIEADNPSAAAAALEAAGHSRLVVDAVTGSAVHKRAAG